MIHIGRIALISLTLTTALAGCGGGGTAPTDPAMLNPERPPQASGDTPGMMEPGTGGPGNPVSVGGSSDAGVLLDPGAPEGPAKP